MNAMTTAFHTFKRGGVQFLMIPNGENASICDTEGNNYGSYLSIESFDKFAAMDGGYDRLILGKVVVSFTSLRSAQ